MKQPDSLFIKNFLNLMRGLASIPKLRRRSVLDKIDAIFINELKKLGIKSQIKKCPYCNNSIKDFKYQRHFPEKCPQIKQKLSLIPLDRRKVFLDEITSLINYIPSVIHEIKPKLKTCPYCGTSVQLSAFGDHADICYSRPRQIKGIKLKITHAVPSSYTGNKRRCRFCGRPPMPGGDVCYSCHSD